MHFFAIKMNFTWSEKFQANIYWNISKRHDRRICANKKNCKGNCCTSNSKENGKTHVFISTFFLWNYRAPQNTPQINTTKPNWTLFCCPSVVKRRATIDNWNEWKKKKFFFFSKLVQLMFLLKRTVYSWDTVLVNVKNPSKVNNSRIFYQYNLECPLSNMPVAFYFVSKTQPFFWNLRPKSSCYWPPRSCFWENWQNLRVKLETSLGRTLSDGTFWVLYTAQSRTIWYGLLRPREDCPA